MSILICFLLIGSAVYLYSLRKTKRRKAKIEPKIWALRARALRMAFHDSEAVARLFLKIRSTHPDRSEQWHWEKVVYDLERDRGYR